MKQTAIFPGRYVQATGALDELGQEVARLGRNALIIAGATAHKTIVPRYASTWQEQFAWTSERFGGECCDEEIERLRVADEIERAREKALDYLSYRPRSEAELERYLMERDFATETVVEVLHRLGQVGLVDDEAFARYWVENREQFRPRGKRALRQELREKGIAPEHVETALAEYDETAAARQVAEEQARRLTHLPPDVFKRRLSQRMARRGFPYNLIQEILATYPFPHFNSEESEDY